MKHLIKTAIKYKKITLVFLVFLLIFGIYNYYISPRQEFPEITAPVALITVQYPGASPEDVEDLVTSKIEDEVTELEGYDYSYSYSKNSVSVTFVRLGINVDYEKVWTDLRERMDEIETELPDQIESLNVNTDLIDTAGLIISLSSDEFSSEHLSENAIKLKDELRRIDGISRIDVLGERQKEIAINIDYQKLNRFNLSLNDIKNLIISNNLKIPSGNLESNGDTITIKTDGTFDSIDDIKKLVIAVSQEDGTIAKLSDIAQIEYSESDDDYLMRQNGKNAVILAGYFNKDENVVLIGDEINRTIDEFAKEISNDIEIIKVSFQPSTIKESLNNFNINLIQGIFFVLVVVFIGLGFKNALIVSTAIPASILITFNFMRFLEIPIHRISIAALIVSLGMLVDNAIVISDSIQVKIDENQNEDKLNSCINGTYEVAIPVLTSTLTTIAAFLPLMMLPSIAGEYLKALPSIIMIALSVSFLIAIFITPTLSYIYFTVSKPKKKKYYFRKYFKKLLVKSLKNKLVTFSLIIVLLILTGFIASKLGLQFFPYADIDLIYIDVHNEKSSDLLNTKQKVIEVENIIKNDGYVKKYTSSIGRGLPKFYNTMPIGSYSEDYGQLVVDVNTDKLKEDKRFADLSEFVDDLQQRIDKVIVGADVVVNRIEQAEPIGHPVRVRVLGDDLDELRDISNDLKMKLESIDSTINVGDDFVDKQYNFKIDINENRANQLGISKFDIQNEVSIAISGREITKFRADNDEYDVVIKSNIKTKEELENLFIKSSLTGNKIQLKNLASIDLISEYPIIKKYDKEKSVLIFSDVRFGANSITVQNELRKYIESLNLPKDVRIIFDGEREKINENFGDVSYSAIIAVALVFLILLIQFHSYLRSLIILFTIPLSAIGSIFGLYLTRQNLSFVAMLGIVSLFGIVVNNAIVLVDFIDRERKNGENIINACKNAFDKRFRPIILSSLTTIIGLMPLIYSRNVMFMPLAIALMSGLLISTLLTLILLPTVYSAVFTKKDRDKVVLVKNQLNSIKNS